MLARVWCNGDSSAGIPGGSTEINLCMDARYIDDNYLRTWIKGLLITCFEELWDDGGVKVMFQDEYEQMEEPYGKD